ncbi:TPA: SDR family oxidoreductase [Candidatus Poribacteria bacterium]|nr:SDR family oxidoreductase [Candidatus Poribacteria bacterium]HIA67774.1 SDR family oxidoreductase [Candidatus Poribacteria bacterium]HIB92034.1 SDR family oxidoreductase [Candidatus Poribacteria bacterium]HIB99254.1 SDR family oxidoreductase [Candidatus Poribacteria bacterium]HIM09596.1 SDR family oxidoreductase [Candidatus Poribacteria bacterium]
MELGLDGKVAVITGGSEGIGKGIARRLSEAGVKVAICARREDVLNQTAQEIQDQTGNSVLAVTADVTVATTLENLIDTTVGRFGRLDILVNNAGRSAGEDFEMATDQIWYEDLDLKLMGAVRCARLVIPHMRAIGGGRIVNITHPGGKQPDAGSCPTSVSRAAGIALTKALSKEFLPDKILVNTVCLTSIKSAQGVRAWKAAGSSGTLEDYWQEEGDRHPLGRLGEPEEVGDLVAFLVSDRAAFITGTAVNIDGGLSAVV